MEGGFDAGHAKVPPNWKPFAWVKAPVATRTLAPTPPILYVTTTYGFVRLSM
jgi:hypothetical protein